MWDRYTIVCQGQILKVFSGVLGLKDVRNIKVWRNIDKQVKILFTIVSLCFHEVETRFGKEVGSSFIRVRLNTPLRFIKKLNQEWEGCQNHISYVSSWYIFSVSRKQWHIQKYPLKIENHENHCLLLTSFWTNKYHANGACTKNFDTKNILHNFYPYKSGKYIRYLRYPLFLLNKRWNDFASARTIENWNRTKKRKMSILFWRERIKGAGHFCDFDIVQFKRYAIQLKHATDW